MDSGRELRVTEVRDSSREVRVIEYSTVGGFWSRVKGYRGAGFK